MSNWGSNLGDLLSWRIDDFRYENTTKEQVSNLHKDVDYYFKSESYTDFCITTEKPNKKVFKLYDISNGNYVFELVEL